MSEDLPWKELYGWEMRKPKKGVSFLASDDELRNLSLSAREVEGLEHGTLTLTSVDTKCDFSVSCYKQL